jgi:hypothetical protein
MNTQIPNLNTKNIREFNETDTIYIRDAKGFNKPLRLCQFVSFSDKNNKVTGKVLPYTEDRREIEGGDTITATLVNCALYGHSPENPNHKFYHWFEVTGYALHPEEEYKVVGNEMHVTKHPSYGLIGVTRINSSQTKLFGSSVQHRNTITLRISTAQHNRSLNNDWFHSNKEIIEVEMSQSQFAQMITTMNVGEGTPCTIRHIQGQRMPDSPFKSKLDLFDEEFEAKMHNYSIDLRKTIKEANEILKHKQTINKGDRDLIINSIERLINQISNGIPFVREQFSEALAKDVNDAKMEIESFTETKVRSLGLEALREQFPSLNLPESSKNDESEDEEKLNP